MNRKQPLLVTIVLFTTIFINAELCHYELVGDLDGNCKVDIVDFAAMAESWLINCQITPNVPDCIPLDIDEDGFDVIADCNDNDPQISPGASETCNDGIDNDCDNLIDCEDSDCFSFCQVVDDAYEDNDSMSQATTGVYIESDLISAYLDEDWFEVEVCAGGSITVDILFVSADGDIDLYLVDSGSQLLDSSETSDNDETVLWTNTGGAPETVYIRVQMSTVGGVNMYELNTVIDSCP